MKYKYRKMRLSTENVSPILSEYKVLWINACQIMVMKWVLPRQVDRVFCVSECYPTTIRDADEIEVDLYWLVDSIDDKYN